MLKSCEIKKPVWTPDQPSLAFSQFLWHLRFLNGFLWCFSFCLQSTLTCLLLSLNFVSNHYSGYQTLLNTQYLWCVLWLSSLFCNIWHWDHLFPWFPLDDFPNLIILLSWCFSYQATCKGAGNPSLVFGFITKNTKSILMSRTWNSFMIH